MISARENTVSWLPLMRGLHSAQTSGEQTFSPAGVQHWRCPNYMHSAHPSTALVYFSSRLTCARASDKILFLCVITARQIGSCYRLLVHSFHTERTLFVVNRESRSLLRFEIDTGNVRKNVECWQENRRPNRTTESTYIGSWLLLAQCENS